MSKFPDASAMRDQTKEAENKKLSLQTKKTLDRLQSMIEEKSKEGSYNLCTDMILSKDVIKNLERNGYIITGDNGAYCEDAGWTISWESE